MPETCHIETYLLNCAALPDPLDADILNQPAAKQALSNERIEQIQRLKHNLARKLSFGAGLLLNYGLEAYFEQDLDKTSGLETSYNAYGKPFFSDGPVFNLSHSGDYAILSMAQKGAPADLLLGCDIEKKSDRRNPEKIARRFFAKQEYEVLQSVSDLEQQTDLFVRYWTAKESVIKLTGAGLALPMNLFDVTDGTKVQVCKAEVEKWQLESAKKPELHQAAEILMHETLYLKTYTFGDYVICVCNNYPGSCGTIREVFSDSFLHSIS